MSGELGTGTANTNSGPAVLGNGVGTGTSSGALHGPALIAQSSPCAGYFPKGARGDHGEVQVRVEVDVAGRASVSSVLIEAPLGQGFAHAARDCARQLRFEPAVGSEGTPMPGHATLKLRFDRRSAG